MTGFARSPPSMIEYSCTLLARFALALVVLLAAGFAGAADSTKTGASAPILTPAQLRDCLSQKDRLHAQKNDVLKDKAALDADKTEMSGAETALNKDVETLDKTNAEAVDAFNARVRARDQMLETYKSKVDVYNAKVDAVTSSQSAYSKACENRRYDQRDLGDPKAKK
jgi:hypothetical protein